MLINQFLFNYSLVGFIDCNQLWFIKVFETLDFLQLLLHEHLKLHL